MKTHNAAPSASPATPKEPVAKPQKRRISNSHRTAPTTAKASDNCDPPFYFQNGIKVYHPGCL